MSNTAHFFAVDPDLLRAHWDPDDFFPPTPGLTWCGNTFEQAYSLRQMLDEIIDPYLSRPLVEVLDGATESVDHPAVSLLRTNEIGVEITPFTTKEFDELRSGVAQALAHADWGPWDWLDDWHALANDRTVGAFYVLAEFV